MVVANERTLKELAARTLDQQPLCIEYTAIKVGEDPNKYVKEFHVVCSSMKSTGVSEEQVKLRAFPFSLADNAKE